MEFQKVFAARGLLLLPMAFCMALLIASQDVMVRFLSLIGLILLEQVRQWLMISAMEKMQTAKKKRQ